MPFRDTSPLITGATRMVTGSVSLAGAVVAGSGYTPSRTGVGQYSIVYGAPFSVAPLVFLQVFNNQPIVGDVLTSTVNGFACSWEISTTGAVQDQNFFFIAVQVS